MIGSGLLALAGLSGLASAGLAALAPASGPGRRASTAALRAAVLALWGAVLLLGWALVAQDTALAYVAEQTRPGTGWARRVSGLWSGAEGSLLLFVSMVATALLVGHRAGPRWQRIGTGVVTAGLAGASRFGADPFTRLDLPPAGGRGMAPILEHGAMLIHPPLLYLGLALALTPALIRDTARTTAHRLGLAALAVLTAALGFGAAWAYVELGWGGWWAWDPIENVALVVWLLLAAALHTRMLDPDRQLGTGLLNAAVLWALCWPAVLAGAALTRTSLRTSVHAFADAASLAAWLWPLVALAAVGVGLRVAEDRPTVPDRGDWPRRAPQAMLTLAALVVAAGTYRPFIGGDATAGWFYSRALFPVAVVGAVLMGVLPGRLPVPRHGLEPAWAMTGPAGARVGAGAEGGGSSWTRVAVVAGVGTAAGLVTAAATGSTRWHQILAAAALGAGLATVVADRPRRAARLAGHLGVLLVVVAAVAGTGSSDSSLRIVEGEVVDVAGHTLELLELRVDEGRRPVVAAEVLVDGDQTLTPSVSYHPDRGLRLPEIATRSRPWLDIQLVLRDVDPEAGVLLTVRFRPLSQLVWWGAALIVVSGLLAAAGRRPRDLSRPREPNRPRDHRRPRDRGQDRDVLGVGDSAPIPLGSQ